MMPELLFNHLKKLRTDSPQILKVLNTISWNFTDDICWHVGCRGHPSLHYVKVLPVLQSSGWHHCPGKQLSIMYGLRTLSECKRQVLFLLNGYSLEKFFSFIPTLGWGHDPLWNSGGNWGCISVRQKVPLLRVHRAGRPEVRLRTTCCPWQRFKRACSTISRQFGDFGFVEKTSQAFRSRKDLGWRGTQTSTFHSLKQNLHKHENF